MCEGLPQGKWRKAAKGFTAGVLRIFAGGSLLQMVQPNGMRIGGAVAARRHRNDNVLKLFATGSWAIGAWHPQQHLVLCQTKLRPFSHGQECGMLRVPGTNAIDDLLSLQQIVLADNFRSLRIPLRGSRVNSSGFARETLGVFAFDNAPR